MIECLLAWVFLILGMFSKNPQLLIAAGAFAIAKTLNDIEEKMR